MAKRRRPAYLLHKATGQARVRIDGKDCYLGVYGSPESRERYDELIAAASMLAITRHGAEESEFAFGKAGNGANVNTNAGETPDNTHEHSDPIVVPSNDAHCHMAVTWQVGLRDIVATCQRRRSPFRQSSYAVGMFNVLGVKIDVSAVSTSV